MALVIKGSSSGQVTVDVPASAGTNSLVLPAESGNILTNDTSGTIIQVVNHQSVTARNTTSTSFVSMSEAVTITPTSSSNKVLIKFDCGIEVTNGGRARFTFYRGSTDLAPSGASCFISEQDTSNVNLMMGCHFLDSPSTTSSTTYTLYVKCESGNQLNLISDVCPLVLTATEIVA